VRASSDAWQLLRARRSFFAGAGRSSPSRRIFQVHRPETLADWLAADTLDAWVKGREGEGGLHTAADDTRPASFRGRLATMPPIERRLLDEGFLFPNQLEAIANLERSLKKDKPRALVQMATGSGKTFFAVTALYRQIKYAGARRVLFLVDRANLGEPPCAFTAPLAVAIPALHHEWLSRAAR
jgi:type I restriction enzyme, R subunit